MHLFMLVKVNSKLCEKQMKTVVNITFDLKLKKTYDAFLYNVKCFIWSEIKMHNCLGETHKSGFMPYPREYECIYDNCG